MWRLQLRPDEPDTRTYRLAEAMGVGRDPDNAIVVYTASLSRYHARFEVQDGRIYVRDLGSTNGTFVNEDRILARLELREGDLVRCGDVRFRLERDTAAPLRTRSLERTSIEELLTGTRQRAEIRLEILLEVAGLLGSPMRLEDLLERIVQLSVDILAVDVAVLLRADGDELRPAVAQGRSSGAGPPQASSAVVDWVRERRVAALFGDATSDDRLAGAQSVVALTIRSSMAAPLVVGDRLLGVLYVDRRRTSRPLADEDLDFLAAFASQAAMAIDHAELNARLAEEAVARNALMRFFPPGTAERLAGGSVDVVETRVTALFCDISGYTALSSSMAPRDVIGLLNRYFRVVAGIVFEHGGTLEKYIGDAVLAVWGAPLSAPDDADRALAAALAIRDRIGSVIGPEGPIRVHVGLNTGDVAAGNVGTPEYLQYATIGDATNVAARICGVAQDGEVLVADDTWRSLTTRWEAEALAPVALKGKAEPFQLWRVARRG